MTCLAGGPATAGSGRQRPDCAPRSIVFDTVAVTLWRSQAVVERTSLAFLIVGAVTLFPAFVVAAAVDSDLRDRAKWSSTSTPDTYPGGPVDLISLAAMILTAGVAIVGAVVLAKHLKRHRASTRAALLAAIVLLVSVLLADSALVVGALRSAV